MGWDGPVSKQRMTQVFPDRAGEGVGPVLIPTTLCTKMPFPYCSPWPRRVLIVPEQWKSSSAWTTREGDGTFRPTNVPRPTNIPRPTNLPRSPGERYSHLFVQDLHPAEVQGGLFFSFLFLNPLQGEANSPPWLRKGTWQ